MKININDIKPLASDLMGHCQKKLGFDHPPELFFQEDEQNATETLGKTAYYSPGEKKVVIYVTGRHGKDILRSLAHELVHHMQNCRGDFDGDQNTDPGYAQNDPHLRNMEAEAYLLGNMLFRDWEDGRKTNKLQENKETLKMNIDALKKMIKEQLLEMLKESPQEETLEEETEELEEDCEVCPDLQEGEKPDFLDLDKDGDKEEPMKDAAAVSLEEAENNEANRNKLVKAIAQGLGDDQKPGFTKSETKRMAHDDKYFQKQYAAYGEEMANLEENLEEALCGDDEEPLEEVLGRDAWELAVSDCARGKDLYGKDKAEYQKCMIGKGWNPDKPSRVDDGSDRYDGPDADTYANRRNDPTKKRYYTNFEENQKVETPEHEQTLYESRFRPRDTNLFERLVKKWVK